MGAYRIEKDALGEVRLHNDVYYGINTQRALDNFAVAGKSVNLGLIHCIVHVKKAACIANNKIGKLDTEICGHINTACDIILSGKYDHQFVTSFIQGGAGTSTNMNVNEVIANVALELMGKQKGAYEYIHPNDHVNLSQSTNDVYPTALKIHLIGLVRKASECFSNLQQALQEKENVFNDILKLGRTQLMDAVPITVGQEFGAWAKAVSRDRWRIYKSEERLRQVNIGGTAIGTSMNAQLKYIYHVTDIIQDLTGYGIARSEFLVDSTQNADVFSEVSGFLKTASVTLNKIANDLRLLASGPLGGFSELVLPKLQQGSSIMPGKTNPIIPEMVIQIAQKVIANDVLITNLCASGQLELNPFLPLIGESLTESLELLIDGVDVFIDKCISGIEVNMHRCKENLEKSNVLAAALIHHIGYDKATQVYVYASETTTTVKEAVVALGFLDKDTVKKIMNTYQLTTAGIPGKEN